MNELLTAGLRSTRGDLDLFDRDLSVSMEELELFLSGLGFAPWAEFFLNPRRLRGSDFLMRWSQGVWSEERIVQAVNDTGRYYALPYGPSSVAPEGDVRELELYFERLNKAGLGKMKRPDLLILRASDRRAVEKVVRDLGGLRELPFTHEDDRRIGSLLSNSILAVKCENSLWRAKQMPNYGEELKPQWRLGGKPGLKKAAVVPTVILKDEDRIPLRTWQRARGVPVHIWHVFYDQAFGVSLSRAEKLIRSGEIEQTKQTFQSPGGATTTKVIYKIYYHHAYSLGEATEQPDLIAASIRACCTNLVSGTLASHKRRSDGTCTLAKLVYATGSLPTRTATSCPMFGLREGSLFSLARPSICSTFWRKTGYGSDDETASEAAPSRSEERGA